MMTYIFSLGAGLLVGIIYSLLGVRSPAPPYIALVGLLGILIGEQVFPIVKERFQNTNKEQTITTTNKKD
jgi:XapX domain-containing protein